MVLKTYLSNQNIPIKDTRKSKLLFKKNKKAMKESFEI